MKQRSVVVISYITLLYYWYYWVCFSTYIQPNFTGEFVDGFYKKDKNIRETTEIKLIRFVIITRHFIFMITINIMINIFVVVISIAMKTNCNKYFVSFSLDRKCYLLFISIYKLKKITAILFWIYMCDRGLKSFNLIYFSLHSRQIDRWAA